MKKLLSILFLAFALIFVTGVSCEEEKPACEQNNTMVMTVKNNASIAVWVDVTEGNDEYNAERRLMPGSSTAYTVRAGSITVWGASDANRTANRWNYEDLYVYSCEDETYSWTNKKGAEGEHALVETEGFGFPKDK